MSIVSVLLHFIYTPKFNMSHRQIFSHFTVVVNTFLSFNVILHFCKICPDFEISLIKWNLCYYNKCKNRYEMY